MNKLLFTLLASIALTTPVIAQTSMSLTYGVKNLDAGTQNHQVGLSVKTKISKSFDLDAAFINDAADVSNSVTTRTEAGVTYTESIYGPVSGYVRVAAGLKQKSGNESFEYYSYEPGVRVKLPLDLTAKVGFRHRESFSANHADKSETMRYALGYALTKNDSIELSYDSQKGDGACTVKSLKYTRAF